MSVSDLDAFFEPAAVAVVGASSDPERIGGRPLRFLREAGFAGPVHAVNKSGGEVQGQRAFPSVLDIPDEVDHAIVCVPVAGVKAAVDECIRKGVRGIQVLTAGFAETGPEGRALQDEIVDSCRRAGVRLIGPNSLGLLNVHAGLHATFSTLLDGAKPRPGPIALATQSGAFGSCAYGMATLRGLGFSKIVATGNEADVDVAECVEYLAGDAATRVILAALESCRDGPRLRRALVAAARAGKPVIAMKVGRTELGASAASTHTGSLAGDDAIYDAVLAECGAWRAQSIEEMLDVAYLCVTAGTLPRGETLGVVTGSGGIGVLVADHAGELGLSMPALPPRAAEAARELLPFAVAANPLDMTAQVTSVRDGIARTLEVMLEGGGYDSVLAYLAHAGLSPRRFEATLPPLEALRRRFPEQRLVLVMLSAPEVTAQLEAMGIPVFADPSRAVKAMHAAAVLRQRRSTLFDPAPAEPAPQALPDVSTEHAAKRVLGSAGLPMLAEALCTSAESAAAAAQAMGFPVVAKIVSPDIAHKTEVGGVLLDLRTTVAVRSAFDQLMTRASQAAPRARLVGVLIAPMVAGGTEVIAGIHRDPTFGLMAMVGIGGTAVELYRDVAFASAPLSPERAGALVDRLRAAAMLRGWRGAPPGDEAALVDALCALSRFAVAHANEIESIDVNPLLVRAEGAACLDAVIVRRTAPPGTP
jgi:acyl-CoA synthetase (NDP forming)